MFHPISILKATNINIAHISDKKFVKIVSNNSNVVSLNRSSIFCHSFYILHYQANINLRPLTVNLMKKKYSYPTTQIASMISENELLASSGLNASITYKAGSDELTYEGFDTITDNWE